LELSALKSQTRHLLLVMPGLVSGIHVLLSLASKGLDGREICAKTRGARHRAALRADPLALLPGHDGLVQFYATRKNP
jgi:hypothetical protein